MRVWVWGLGLEDGVEFEILGLGVSVWFLIWALKFGVLCFGVGFWLESLNFPISLSSAISESMAEPSTAQAACEASCPTVRYIFARSKRSSRTPTTTANDLHPARRRPQHSSTCCHNQPYYLHPAQNVEQLCSTQADIYPVYTPRRSLSAMGKG